MSDQTTEYVLLLDLIDSVIATLDQGQLCSGEKVFAWNQIHALTEKAAAVRARIEPSTES